MFKNFIAACFIIYMTAFTGFSCVAAIAASILYGELWQTVLIIAASALGFVILNILNLFYFASKITESQPQQYSQGASINGI